MIDWKLRQILRNVKKKNPQKRFEALDDLFSYKREHDLKIQIEVLQDFIKAAASRFPEPVDSWDNPSFYLTDFACDYLVPATIKALMTHFDHLDSRAQERAIQALLTTEDEEVFYFLEEKLVNLIETDQIEIPYSEIAVYPLLAKGIVEKTIHKISSPYHKFGLYELILAIHNTGYATAFKKEIVLPVLLEDYQQEKQSYLKYDCDYDSKFVYSSWKDSIFIIRNRMILYIRLMEYYFTNAAEKELNDALTFQDPFIKLHALLICISKNLPYEKDVLYDCASNIETAELTYWKLVDKNLIHLYPFTNEAETYLAKTRLFFTVINGASDDEPVYPEEMKIIDDVDLRTLNGLLAKHYLISFKHHDTEYVGWAGGFLPNDDGTFDMTNGTHSDFIQFNSMTIDEHKQAFLKQENEIRETYKEEILYESAPKLSNVVYLFIFPVVAKWLQIALGYSTSIILTMIATLILGTYIIYKVTKNKNRKVTMSGQQLIKQDGSRSASISIYDIKSIKRNKKTITIYNQNDQIALEVPLNWINYEILSLYLKEHTSFLQNPPFIQS